MINAQGRGRWSPYVAVLSARYRMLLQYRAAAIAGAGTQFFWGLLNLTILEAFYRSSSEQPAIAFAELVPYVWLGQAFLALLPWNHDRELEQMIRRGGVVFELLRPIDLYAFWYTRTLATRVANTSLRCLPIFVFAGFVLPLTPLESWSLRLPPSPAAAAAFAIALVVAVLLGAAITMLIHVSLLWTVSGDGMARLVPAMVILFSGLVVPLPLFPDWSQPFLATLPFRALADLPNRLYSGSLGIDEGLLPVLLSLSWTVVLVWVGRSLLARGTRALVLQGG